VQQSKDNPFGVKALKRTPAISTGSWTARKAALKRAIKGN